MLFIQANCTNKHASVVAYVSHQCLDSHTGCRIFGIAMSPWSRQTRCLQEYCHHNPIPLEGNWDAVSGEEFLRNLLTGGVNETRYSGGVTNPMFCNFDTIGIDPRAIGQRIMDIRSALAKVCQPDADASTRRTSIDSKLSCYSHALYAVSCTLPNCSCREHAMYQFFWVGFPCGTRASRGCAVADASQCTGVH